MNFFDPQRPRLGNQAPAFNTEKLQGALPSLTVVLHAPGQVRVTLFLPVTQTRYRPQWREFKVEALAWFLADYENDPEECLRLYFGWDLTSVQDERLPGRSPGPSAPLGSTNQSADDLGF